MLDILLIAKRVNARDLGWYKIWDDPGSVGLLKFEISLTNFSGLLIVSQNQSGLLFDLLLIYVSGGLFSLSISSDLWGVVSHSEWGLLL